MSDECLLSKVQGIVYYFTSMRLEAFSMLAMGKIVEFHVDVAQFQVMRCIFSIRDSLIANAFPVMTPYCE